MILHPCQQNTDEWRQLRVGRPTSSNFDQIVTKSGKLSTSSKRYLHTLLAERMMGHAVEQFQSQAMRDGQAGEAEAVAYYEMMRGSTTTPCGFGTTDDGRIGASPDRLVGDDGLLEIKCPKEHTHVGYLLAAERAVDDPKGHDYEYRCQTQGQLWIFERAWVDIVSYHPEMPEALIRVYRDEEFISTLAKELRVFAQELDDVTDRLRAAGMCSWETRLLKVVA